MTTCTAFSGQRRLASGSPVTVALAVRSVIAEGGGHTILTFDDSTGKPIDFDLRGTPRDIAARLSPAEVEEAVGGAAVRRPVGRPKLGVIPREVTLLPRHWDWLAEQPGGASVALRKLVDAARAADKDAGARQRAQAAADRFMQAMLGDAVGYEEAARALYASDALAFERLSAPWPADLRAYARALAAPAFV